MIERRHQRYEIFSRATWDYFASGQGSKRGLITNISRAGCLLRTSELIEHRRWLRILAEARGNVHLSIVGRVTRCENIIESFGPDGVTLYRYGIELTYPEAELADEPDVVFAPVPSNVAYLAQPERSAQVLKRS